MIKELTLNLKNRALEMNENRIITTIEKREANMFLRDMEETYDKFYTKYYKKVYFTTLGLTNLKLELLLKELIDIKNCINHRENLAKNGKTFDFFWSSTSSMISYRNDVIIEIMKFYSNKEISKFFNYGNGTIFDFLKNYSEENTKDFNKNIVSPLIKVVKETLK